MTITRNFKLCLNAGSGSAPYINVNQYDEGETWLFELYSENGERYIPSSGAIVGVKSDGHGIVNTGTVDSEGRVVITETQQMTASAGRAIYELSIDGLTHGTANFIVAVERKPTDDAVMSDSDLSLIQEAIDSAEVIVEVIGDSDPSEVIGEHVDAWLDAHPEATTTVLDGAITAPKINNSLWDKLLVSEEASGAVASFDDGADDVPVSSLKVALEPIQTGSGDPSPTNIRPIIAANGKNKYNSLGLTAYSNNGITVTESNGTLTFNGTATANAYFTLPNLALTQGDYVFSVNNASANSNVHYSFIRINGQYFGDNTLNTVNKISYHTVSSINSVVFYVVSGTTLTNFTVKPQLEMGTVVTTYQPYQGIMVDRAGKNLAYVSSGNNIVIANCTKGVTYTFSLRNSGTCGFNLKKNSISGQTVGSHIAVSSPVISATFTADEDFNLFLNGYGSGGVTFVDAASEYQLEVGTEATEYEEYVAPTQYPYTLGQSVYGGTVDLATGVLTVDKAIVDLGTLSWTYDSSVPRFYSSGLSSLAKRPATNYIKANIICSVYQTVSVEGTPSLFGGVDKSIAVSTAGMVNARDEAYTTAAAFTTAVSGAQLVYELATPTTVQLTPTEVKTLLGYNNISSSGTIDVIYHADTKLYIDKKIGELS